MVVSLSARIGGPQQGDSALLREAALDNRVCVPGVVNTFDHEQLTANVEIAAQGVAYDDHGRETDETYPLLVDVPVVFPRGGGLSLTFPIKQGDECLVVFADRCIDFWHQSGGMQKTASQRGHDLGDAFIIPGPYSQPQTIDNVSTDSVQLRTDDGTAFIEMDQNGNITINCPTITVNAQQAVVNAPSRFKGDMQVEGSITASGDVTGAGISLDTHVHAGVTPGDDETEAPE